MVDKLDVTSSSHLGLQALIAGIFRGDGNVKGVVNDAAYIWSTTPKVQAGNTGTLRFYVGETSAPFFTVPCLITKVHLQSEVAGRVDYDFDVSLSILSGSGLYVYPA